MSDLELGKRHFILRTIIIYALVGALWIFLSDSVLGWVVHDPAVMVKFGMYKGALFIVLTSLILFVLLTHYARALIATQIDRRRSEERFTAVASLSPDVITIMTAEGKTLYNSAATEQIHGFTAQELLGINVFDYIHPDDQKRVQAGLGRVLERPGAVHAVEYRFRNKDGSYTWMESRAGNQTQNPLLQGLFIINRDISERKRAEEALLENQRLLKTVIDYSPNIIFIKDKDGRYLLVNKGLEDLVGFSNEQITGKVDADLFPKEVADSFRRTDMAVMTSRKPSVYDVSLPTRGQERAFLSTKFPIFDEDGNVAGVCGLAMDVTEKNRADRERETLRAEIAVTSRLASIGMLAAGVAHEINNPLAIIKGNCELLKDSLLERSQTAPELDTLERICQATTRIASIINGLRSYARIDDGEANVPVNLHSVIHDTVAMCGPIYRHDGTEIELRLGATNSIFNGSTGKMQQILLNLLSNARDALAATDAQAKRPGSIIIETSDGEGEVVLRVRDQGCGIASENLSKIFNPFFTTKAPGKGTGLGLPLVQTMILSFGGRIEVSSEVGRGSCFSVRLPLAQHNVKPGRQAPAGTREDEARKFSGRVLLVDDEPEVRVLVSRFLAQSGLTTTEASDGREALELLKKHHFDLVVTDLKMPNMSGLGLLAEATRVAPHSTRYVVMTGGFIEDYPPEQQELIRRFSQGFLSKPFDRKSLVDVLARLLD